MGHILYHFRRLTLPRDSSFYLNFFVNSRFVFCASENRDMHCIIGKGGVDNMSIEENKAIITRNRRRYGYNMNLGEVLECIKDIKGEVDRNRENDPDCYDWIASTLNAISLSIHNHSLEEGILPSSYLQFSDVNRLKRAGYRTLERDVSDLWTIIEELPCRNKNEKIVCNENCELMDSAS